jgi:hypothetical protein
MRRSIIYHILGRERGFLYLFNKHNYNLLFKVIA